MAIQNKGRLNRPLMFWSFRRLWSPAPAWSAPSFRDFCGGAHPLLGEDLRVPIRTHVRLWPGRLSTSANPDLTRDVTAVKAAVKRLTPEDPCAALSVDAALLSRRWHDVLAADQPTPGSASLSTAPSIGLRVYRSDEGELSNRSIGALASLICTFLVRLRGSTYGSPRRLPAIFDP